MTNQTAANIDDLLDGTLDDLADAPSFKPFPAGAHVCKLNWEVKTIGTSPAVELKLTHVSTAELANEGDTMPAPGDTTSVAFILKKKDGSQNELGEGQWKEILAALKSGGVEGNSNREIMAASENMEVMVVTTVRVDKKDPQDIKYYTGVKSVSVI
jgi:hypothetical protein